MWHPRRRRLTLYLLALGFGLSGSARDAVTQSNVSYGVTDLGTLGGASSVALGIDEDAFPASVGYAATSSGAEHAFYGSAWVMQDLGTLGGARSEARATVAGRVVGRAQIPSGAYHAFQYATWEGMTDLGTLGGSESYATDINNQLVVVGASRTAGDASVRAFVYENGAMAPLGATLGGTNTLAMAINNQGHVAGHADRPAGQAHHAFLYANGVTTDLGSLGNWSEAYALNDAGVVVGRSQVGSGANHHAFRYAAGVLQDLGTLGGASSEALDVDGNGAIVGWSDTSQGERRAFIWHDGDMTDLNGLIPAGTGWVLEAATAISENGEIAGYGALNGQRRAFVLTPPIDLSINLVVHANDESTNFPDPHEAGRELLLGVSVYNQGPHTASGITITDTITGPVEYLAWQNGECDRAGQRLTCRVGPVEFGRDLFIGVRTTGAGTIGHSATIAADQPDPNLTNNSAGESNRAISLASLTLNPTTVAGGKLSLGRATLTSPTGSGGSTVKLTSSHPEIASVPSQFDVLPWSGGGLWREFWVTTKPVSAPVTVQISGTHGLVTVTVPLTIMPAGSQWPFGGTAWPIPGTIQAEDFDEGGEGVSYHDQSRGNNGGAYRSTDVDIEVARDTGGGANVGWIAAGEWLEYSVNVASTRTYTLEARVASQGAGGTFHIDMDGTNRTGTMSVPDTGGWQVWTTITRPVTLDAGVHTLRVSFDGTGPGGHFGNLNYLRLTAPIAGPTPFGATPMAVPGTIQAEDFDDGGEGVAYHDASAGNAGGRYRATGVDIQPTTDTGGGYNVGWMSAGEWLQYTVSVAENGAYTLTARVAASGAGGTFHVEAEGVNKTGPLTIPNTGGWQKWTDVTATVTLNAGVQSMRFVADGNGPTGAFANLNYLRFARTAP